MKYYALNLLLQPAFFIASLRCWRTLDGTQRTHRTRYVTVRYMTVDLLLLFLSSLPSVFLLLSLFPFYIQFFLFFTSQIYSHILLLLLLLLLFLLLLLLFLLFHANNPLLSLSTRLRSPRVAFNHYWISKPWSPTSLVSWSWIWSWIQSWSRSWSAGYRNVLASFSKYASTSFYHFICSLSSAFFPFPLISTRFTL